MRKIQLGYRYKLLAYMLVLLGLISLFFALYYLKQSRGFSINTIEAELSKELSIIYDQLSSGVGFENVTLPENLNFTYLDSNARVIYDSRQKMRSYIENQSRAPELVRAAQEGQGAVLRISEEDADGEEYLFYAKKYKGAYLRTYTKYETLKPSKISGNKAFAYMVVLIFIGLVGGFLFISQRLYKPIRSYNNLVTSLKNNDPQMAQIKFDNDEFGEFGREIVNTFQQLEKIKKYKQQLSHNIAHELKTPVTGIMAYLETILSSDELSAEQMKHFVKKAYTQTERLAGLINEVSILNKLDEYRELAQNNPLFSIEEVNLRKIIAAVFDEVGYKFERKGVKLHLLMDNNLIIKGSYNLLYSLFKNLIDNSLEHGFKESEQMAARSDLGIWISAELSPLQKDGPQAVNVVFQDNGIGVQEEALDRIFERFYRVDEGRTRKIGGSGLGLAIVKNAVAFHNGNITAHSREGGGIVFRFSLLSKS